MRTKKKLTDFLEDRVNGGDDTIKDSVQTLVLRGIAPCVDSDRHVCLDNGGHIPGYRGGGGRGEDAESEEGDSGESERAHCEQRMSVRKRVVSRETRREL